MRETIVGNWRTTLLGVSILLALLMFTQGKISATEFLAILGFFTGAGYILAKDARTASQSLGDELATTKALLTGRRRPARRGSWLGEVAYRLLVVFIVAVLLLCFYPLMRDALQERTTPRTYNPGTGGLYSSPGYGSPVYPTPAVLPPSQPTGTPAPPAAPAHGDDEPPHPASGPGPGLAH